MLRAKLVSDLAATAYDRAAKIGALPVGLARALAEVLDRGPAVPWRLVMRLSSAPWRLGSVGAERKRPRQAHIFGELSELPPDVR